MRKVQGKSNLFGEFLKNKRLEKKLNRTQMARELQLLGLDMSVDDIYRIETSRILLKDFELVACALALEIDLNELKNIYKNFMDTQLSSVQNIVI